MFDYKTEDYREVVKGKVGTNTWQRKSKAIRDMVPDETGLRILELGCGEIPIFETSLRVDIAPIYKKGYLRHDMNKPLPLDEKYDIIVSLELVGHLFDPTAFIEQCHRLLADGGRLIISARNVGWWKTRLQLLRGEDDWFTNGYYVSFFTPDSFKRRLRDHGFQIIYEYNKNPRLPLSLSHGFMFVCKKRRHHDCHVVNHFR